MSNNKKAKIFRQEDHIYNQKLYKNKDFRQIKLLRVPSLQQDIAATQLRNFKKGKKIDQLANHRSQIKEVIREHQNKQKNSQQHKNPQLGKKRSQQKFRNGLAVSLKSQLNKYEKTGMLSDETAELIKVKFVSKQKVKKHKEKRKLIYFTKGNNHQLVRQLFTTKFSFVQTQSRQSANICWLQSISQRQNGFKGYKSSNEQRLPEISKLKNEIGIIYNYLEGQSQLTNKQRLYLNMKKYYPDSIGNYIPLSFIINFKYQQNIVQERIHQFLAYYFKKQAKKNKIKQFNVKNYFMEISISNKQISKYLEKSASNLHYSQNDSNQEKSQHNFDRNLWILKPSSLNRGRGIYLFTTLKQLSKLLSQSPFQISVKMYQQSMKPKSFIIQEYIDKPLLIDGFKFDMRMWVFIHVLKINGKKVLKAYLFQHGYSRLASIKYDINSQKQMNQQFEKQGQENNSQQKISPKKEKNNYINNKFIHLTNNAVQKQAKQYGQFCEGNQLSIEDTIKYFQEKQKNCPLNLHNVLQSMKKMIFESISSVKQRLLAANNPKTFQILGYDFLLDHNYKMWLIEINCNPCLEESSQLLGKLLRQMLSGLIVLSELQQQPSHLRSTEGWVQIL